MGGRPIIDQCGGTIVADHKAADTPQRFDTSKKACRTVRLQIHIKAIEGDSEAASASFNVSFLAGSTPKESFDLPLSRKPGKRSHFSRGEIVVRNVLAIDIGANSLDVYPDVAIPTEGENSNILRMRQIEI